MNMAVPTVLKTAKKKISNETNVRQIHYDAFGEKHLLMPGKSKTIEVMDMDVATGKVTSRAAV